MNLDRRNFLSNTLAIGATVAAAGCINARNKLTGFAGAPMQGFADKPFEKVRVGIVGIGYRGVHAADSFSPDRPGNISLQFRIPARARRR